MHFFLIIPGFWSIFEIVIKCKSWVQIVALYIHKQSLATVGRVLHWENEGRRTLLLISQWWLNVSQLTPCGMICQPAFVLPPFLGIPASGDPLVSNDHAQQQRAGTRSILSVRLAAAPAPSSVTGTRQMLHVPGPVQNRGKLICCPYQVQLCRLKPSTGTRQTRAQQAGGMLTSLIRLGGGVIHSVPCLKISPSSISCKKTNEVI